VAHQIAALENRSQLAILAETAERAKEYGRNSKSAATRLAYASDWRNFVAFAIRNELAYLPAAPQTVALYLTELADAGKSVATIRRRIAAIADQHDETNVENPTSSKPVRAILSGISREKGVAPTRKAALTIDLLKDALLAMGDGKLPALRDRAVFLVGFHAALRRSEIAALNVEDLRFEREGVVLTVRKSKTDQEGAGYEIGLPSHPVEAICPVRALRAWLDASTITEGALFRSFSMNLALQQHRLDGRDVARLIQRVAKRAGLEGDLAGHSLRAGFVTSAAKAGVALDSIARVSRHKSTPILLGYIRRAQVFEDAPQLLLK
jgi:integrase